MDTASKLRKLREEKGYSQDYLATMLGISKNAYSRLELGQSRISVERLEKLADILDVSMVSLLNERENQVFNIRSNETINGNIIRESQNEKELFERLLQGKDELIATLKEQIVLLQKVIDRQKK